ncbi:MAG: DUF1127 domain-containing protein [Pseudomonadota bacterium]
MAALAPTRPHVTALTGGLLKPVSALYDAVTAWADARATRKALSQLSEYQRYDIGLTSADIDLFVAKYR